MSLWITVLQGLHNQEMVMTIANDNLAVKNTLNPTSNIRVGAEN